MCLRDFSQQCAHRERAFFSPRAIHTAHMSVKMQLKTSSDRVDQINVWILTYATSTLITASRNNRAHIYAHVTVTAPLWTWGCPWSVHVMSAVSTWVSVHSMELALCHKSNVTNIDPPSASSHWSELTVKPELTLDYSVTTSVHSMDTCLWHHACDCCFFLIFFCLFLCRPIELRSPRFT